VEAERLVSVIADAVVKRLQLEHPTMLRKAHLPGKCADYRVPVGISNRHVHLSVKDARALFGTERFAVYKNLSQPGQFACSEKVTLVGPAGVIENVRVLGPVRQNTQVEISVSDGIKLGLQAPVRESGDIKGSVGIILVGPSGAVSLPEGVIVAARHLHMHSVDAIRFGIRDGEKVSAKTSGPRGIVFNEVLARVGDKYALEMHVDIDEANAAGLCNGDHVEIIRSVK